MRRSKPILALLLLAFLPSAHASSFGEAGRLAATLAETVLRSTYGVADVRLSARTERYETSGEPERFWFSVTSGADVCGGASDEVGEIYVRYVGGSLHSLQWLPSRDPQVRAAAATRARVFAWARDVLGLQRQTSVRSVPSTVPTQHIEFSGRDEHVTVRLVVDTEYGFLHGAYVSRSDP